MNKIYSHSCIILGFTLSSIQAAPEVDFATHVNFGLGLSSQDSGLEGYHGHDLNNDFTLQGIELHLATKFNEYFDFNLAHTIFEDDRDFDNEWENAHANFHLPNQRLSLKAGRIFNETTSENSSHVHSWSFANSSLLTTRFNGEEGLISESLQLSWGLPGLANTYFHISHGNAIEDDHGEEEEEELQAGQVEGDVGFFTSSVTTAAITSNYRKDDFNQWFFRAHYSAGDNGFERNQIAYGMSAQYQWRKNGQEPGGDYFTAGAEWANKRVNFASEDGLLRGSDSELGLSFSAVYGFAENWEAGLRYEYLEGSDTLSETPSIERISAAMTRRFELNNHLNGHVRFQLDHINRDEVEDATVAWLQFQFSFGAKNF